MFPDYRIDTIHYHILTRCYCCNQLVSCNQLATCGDRYRNLVSSRLRHFPEDFYVDIWISHHKLTDILLLQFTVIMNVCMKHIDKS